MTGEEFKAIRRTAGLSVSELAALLRIVDERAVRRWEDGTKEVSGPVSLLMELLALGVTRE